MSQENTDYDFETDFKIGQILEKQNKSNQALGRYCKILNKFRELIQKSPNAKNEFSFPLLSLARIIDILKLNGGVDQSYNLLTSQKKLIEYFKEINSNSSFDSSNEIIFSIFDEIDLNLKSDPVKAARDVLNNYIKEQQQQKNQNDKENMLHLLNIVEAKKKKIQNSKTQRIIEWINDNPFSLLIFGFIFLGILMMIVFSVFSTEGQRERYEKRLEAKKKIYDQIKDDPLNAEIIKKNKNGHKMTEEEYKKFQEKMQEIQKKVHDNFGLLNNVKESWHHQVEEINEVKNKEREEL